MKTNITPKTQPTPKMNWGYRLDVIEAKHPILLRFAFFIATVMLMFALVFVLPKFLTPPEVITPSGSISHSHLHSHPHTPTPVGKPVSEPSELPREGLETQPKSY